MLNCKRAQIFRNLTQVTHYLTAVKIHLTLLYRYLCFCIMQVVTSQKVSL